jgi:small subunit ribosomal protein S8
MMTSTDPIADMLTRIRNASRVGKTTVSFPHSNMKVRVLDVLKSMKTVASYRIVSVEKSVAKNVEVVINAANTNPNFESLKRLSTPGRRSYVAYSEIPKVKQGRGYVIISTSKGVMTGELARSSKLGGELIAEIY